MIMAAVFGRRSWRAQPAREECARSHSKGKRWQGIELKKVLGSDNLADVLTKYVNKPILDKALKFLGLAKMDGRAACAPKTLGFDEDKAGK